MAAAIMMAHAATVAATCARVVTDAVAISVDIIAALAAIAISTVAGVIIAHAVAVSIDKIATAACAMVIADAIAIGVYIIVAHAVTVGIHVVAIAKAAAVYHDTSYNFSVTYRNVYKNMNTDWNEAHIQFRNRYHRTAQQLKTLVMYSGVLFDRFNAAVNTYINAASKKEA